jgi:hypothetical protein
VTCVSQRQGDLGFAESGIEHIVVVTMENRSFAAFAVSAVNQILAKRTIERQQMRWNRETVQPFLTVRVAVLNDTVEQAFRLRRVGFRPRRAVSTTV